jgi:hypothetical protein
VTDVPASYRALGLLSLRDPSAFGAYDTLWEVREQVLRRRAAHGGAGDRTPGLLFAALMAAADRRYAGGWST